MVKRVVRTTVTTIEKSARKKRKKAAQKKTTTRRPVRKKTRRRTATRRPATRRTSSTDKNVKKILDSLEKRDRLLVENFVGLQKAMATLSVRFSELSQNMGNLLAVFEQAARTLAASEKQVDTTLTSKLDTLIEQNKGLSRELTLVDSKMRRSKGAAPTPAGNSASPSLYSRQIPPTQSPSANMAPTTQSAIPPKQLPRI